MDSAQGLSSANMRAAFDKGLRCDQREKVAKMARPPQLLVLLLLNCLMPVTYLGS
jgi:hypothetical protein